MKKCLAFTNKAFWWQNPALLVSLTVLIGVSRCFWAFPWNWIFPILWAIYLILIRSPFLIFLIAISMIYSTILYPKEIQTRKGYFSIASLQPHQSPFHKGLVYKGVLSAQGQKIPCTIFHSKEKAPKADCDYIVEGKFTQKSPCMGYFKVNRWTKVSKTWSLASFRYEMKERFRNYLDQRFQKRVSNLIGSLLTGDVEDRMLRYQFGKLGLQHILAISGFHFAILIAFCSAFLCLFLPYQTRLIVLLIAVNLYFLFIGFLPAVQRAWLMSSLYLLEKLMLRHSSPLNLLGSALLIEVILDPLICTSVGFQLSFASCMGILLFLPRIQKRFTSAISIESSSAFQLHTVLVSRFFKEAISITLSVNLAIAPILLYHFHTFPLLSFLYNLFFPFLISLSLFGTLLAMTADLILGPLADLLFFFTNFFTNQILDLASYPPVFLDYSLKVHHFPAWILPFYLFALFISVDLNRTSSIKS